MSVTLHLGKKNQSKDVILNIRDEQEEELKERVNCFNDWLTYIIFSKSIFNC